MNKYINIIPIRILLLFMLIYNISFKVLPSLTTTRIAIIIMTYIYIRNTILSKNIKMKKCMIFIVLGYIFSIIYAFIIFKFSYGSDDIQFARIINFIIISIYGAFLISKIYNNLESFLCDMALVTAIQAVFIIISFLSYDFREIVSNILISGTNIPIINGSRVAGFTNSSGAALSLVQSIGAISSIYIWGKKNKVIYMIIAIIIAISIFFTGATGLIFLFIVGPYLIFIKFKCKKIIKCIFIGIITINISILVLGIFLDKESGSQFEYLKNNFQEKFKVQDNETIKSLKNMKVPEITAETIIGTSKLKVINGKNPSGSDIGYIQTYYAMGFIGSFVIYTTIILHFIFKCKVLKNKRDSYLFIAIMILLEFKEPFIFKYMYSLFLFSFINLSIKEENYG